MTKEKSCIHCNKQILKKAKICKYCGKFQYKSAKHKSIMCKWCKEKISFNASICPHCKMEKNKSIKKSENSIFGKFIIWFIKPKSYNMTVCWIYTLAAILSISCWLIIGENGLMVGAVLGGAFAAFGFFITLIMMDQ